MDLVSEKFAKLGCDNAPGQEINQKEEALSLIGDKLEGRRVDFSHGDVDAHPPIPGSLEAFNEGFAEGGVQAYTEYKGRKTIRDDLAAKLADFTGAPVDPLNLIVTPGTQCALFLAMGATVGRGDKVAIVEPDYFANRKLVEFFDGELVPIYMDFEKGEKEGKAGLDLAALEEGFKQGVKVFLFSNPNNPTGVIYSAEEIAAIASLAKKYGVTVIADQLYSRQVFDGRPYTHLRAQKEVPENLITILGPSKTESMSGFRLGVAFGSPLIIARMEKLQAIVSLRASGYNQAVLKNWFDEPEGWLADRIAQHQQIRDDLLAVLRSCPGVYARTTEAGSYLFVTMPELKVSSDDFVKILRKQADVIVTPGTEFGPQFTNSFRINFSQDHDAAVEAIRRTVTLIERYRK